MANFKLVSKFKPAGDQPKAIKALVDNLKKGLKHQVLLGVTGSGKTFTIANVIQKIQKPTLVIAHNKTLAAQLTNEFRQFFPYNSVNYFVSYYDYYQPEAYIPTTDTYIDKEALINDEIDKLRHAATTALLTRKDVIIVASVSCIYGLGAPDTYAQNIIYLRVGDRISRSDFIHKLVSLQFARTNADLKRGTFRLKGNNWEIMPPDKEKIYSIEVKDEVVEKIEEVDPVIGFSKSVSLSEIFIAPAKHFITLKKEREGAIAAIKKELKERLKYFESQRKFLEAERLERRTKFDIAMIEEIGYCHGIENYSRHLSGRAPGEPPATLLDYFPSDFLTIIDESHITIPQIQGMYEGDASRKKILIEYGFRLPSAADNRPLKFEEFEEKLKQIIYTSATPGSYEIKKCQIQKRTSGTAGIIEQIIRPTGLVDPKITIKPARRQVQDIILEINKRIKANERVLITTLTKRMAEDLTDYLSNQQAKSKKGEKIRAAYLHSDIKTLDRIKILTDLRKGKFNVLVGVNLLREGLDLPEVSLVAILDADKEGFLRSETSLIQTIGRAARNANGEVIIYADKLTGSIKKAIRETERRRKIQLSYNKKRKIIPKTITKEISDILPNVDKILELETKPLLASKEAIETLIKQKEKEMKEAAQRLDFEIAAILRDEIRLLLAKLKKLKKPDD